MCHVGVCLWEDKVLTNELWLVSTDSYALELQKLFRQVRSRLFNTGLVPSLWAGPNCFLHEWLKIWHYVCRWVSAVLYDYVGLHLCVSGVQRLLSEISPTVSMRKPARGDGIISLTSLHCPELSAPHWDFHFKVTLNCTQQQLHPHPSSSASAQCQWISLTKAVFAS